MEMVVTPVTQGADARIEFGQYYEDLLDNWFYSQQELPPNHNLVLVQPLITLLIMKQMVMVVVI